ncbi:hypothetical protein B0H19DRAFT_1381662 [Mycena capillaripes]|nr:hypothetical protein B0H19DRAFT_1381662 [Mycena capillaripes]
MSPNFASHASISPLSPPMIYAAGARSPRVHLLAPPRVSALVRDVRIVHASLPPVQLDDVLEWLILLAFVVLSIFAALWIFLLSSALDVSDPRTSVVYRALDLALTSLLFALCFS